MDMQHYIYRLYIDMQTYTNYMDHMTGMKDDEYTVQFHVLIPCGGLGLCEFKGGSFSNTDLAILR